MRTPSGCPHTATAMSTETACQVAMALEHADASACVLGARALAARHGPGPASAFSALAVAGPEGLVPPVGTGGTRASRHLEQAALAAAAGGDALPADLSEAPAHAVTAARAGRRGECARPARSRRRRATRGDGGARARGRRHAARRELACDAAGHAPPARRMDGRSAPGMRRRSARGARDLGVGVARGCAGGRGRPGRHWRGGAVHPARRRRPRPVGRPRNRPGHRRAARARAAAPPAADRWPRPGPPERGCPRRARPGPTPPRARR